MITEYGGRCTGSVSGKTDYLVVGYKMEDGREVTQGGKYKGAKAKGTKIIDEQGFEQLMKQKLGDKEFRLLRSNGEDKIDGLVSLILSVIKNTSYSNQKCAEKTKV